MSNHLKFQQEQSSLLTHRELICLKLASDDKSCAEIANSMFISIKTVRTHHQNIRRKLGCKTIHGAICRAMALGLIDIDD